MASLDHAVIYGTRVEREFSKLGDLGVAHFRRITSQIGPSGGLLENPELWHRNIPEVKPPNHASASAFHFGLTLWAKPATVSRPPPPAGTDAHQEKGIAVFGTQPGPSPETDEVSVICDVVASASAVVPAEETPRLREPLLAAFRDRLSNALLKQADEQSLVALRAFCNLFERWPELRRPEPNWGLIVAPRVPGRKRVLESIARFREQGAWSISPHIIPHCTLHSLAGLLSQVLDLHGPNTGTGGKPGCEGEAFAVAGTWLAAEGLPGLWLVLTGWDRESATYRGSMCQAVVLGLKSAARPGAAGHSRLTISPTAASPHLPLVSLEALRATMENSIAPSAWRLGLAGVLTLQPATRALETAA
jgi:hypothetical protein